jgi:hypothetical protein
MLTVKSAVDPVVFVLLMETRYKFGSPGDSDTHPANIRTATWSAAVLEIRVGSVVTVEENDWKCYQVY